MKKQPVTETNLRIAFFGVKPWERSIIEREIINLNATGVGIFETELHENLRMAQNYDIVSVFVYSRVDKEVLTKLPNLKMVATRSTGIDHIDVKECEKRKIVVSNVPVYGSNTVAEYAMALLLAVAKKIVPAHQSVENGEFSPEGLTGVDLHGKTIGVVGVGKIGQNMVRLSRAFGMKVLGGRKECGCQICKKTGFYKHRSGDLPETCGLCVAACAFHPGNTPSDKQKKY